MFEKFTDRARRLVVLAEQEARDMNHGELGPDHLLLGAWQEGESLESLARLALDKVGFDYDKARAYVDFRHPVDTNRGHIPFTPAAKITLERAWHQSTTLGVPYVAPEHFLLAADDERAVQELLADQGITATQLEAAVFELIERFTPAEEPRAAPEPTSPYVLTAARAAQLLAWIEGFRALAPLADDHVLACVRREILGE